MYGIQNVAKIAPKIVSVGSQPARTATFIASKPRQRISFVEKVVHGMILFTVPLLVPIYCSVNFNNWRPKAD